MADFALSTVGVFPAGTQVGAYPLSNWPNGDPDTGSAAVGSATDTQTMGAHGLTFTDLAERTSYAAYALVGSNHRYVLFRTGRHNEDEDDDAAEAAPTKFAPIEATGDGPNEIVAAVAGKKIRVIGYKAQGEGTVPGDAEFQDGDGNALGHLRIALDGTGAAYAGDTDAPAFETPAGKALVLDCSSGLDVKGHLTYVLI